MRAARAGGQQWAARSAVGRAVVARRAALGARPSAEELADSPSSSSSSSSSLCEPKSLISLIFVSLWEPGETPNAAQCARAWHARAVKLLNIELPLSVRVKDYPESSRSHTTRARLVPFFFPHRARRVPRLRGCINS